MMGSEGLLQGIAGDIGKVRGRFVVILGRRYRV
jgi:hypothetical protein